MGDFIAMAREGTMYSRGGIDLSWPLGGLREVIELKDADRPYPILQRIANGAIVEVDGPATEQPQVPETPHVLEGDEARKVREEPAGPVTRMAYDRATDSLRPVPIMGSPIEPPLPTTPEQDEINQSVRAIAQAAAERYITDQAKRQKTATAAEIDEVVRKAIDEAEDARAEDREVADAKAKSPSRPVRRQSKTSNRRGSPAKAKAKPATVTARLNAHLVGKNPDVRSEAPEGEPITSTGEGDDVPGDVAGGTPAERRTEEGSPQLG